METLELVQFSIDLFFSQKNREKLINASECVYA